MSIQVKWLENSGRQIIHFHQQETWTWDEYDNAVDEIVEMIETSPQYVTVLVDLTGAITNTRGKKAFQHFTRATSRWQALPMYAQFFMVLNPSYWAQITLFLIEKVTASLTMNTVVSIDDAIEKGLARIAKYVAEQPKNDELADTP